MANSSSSASVEAPKSTPVPSPPAPDLQRSAEPEVDQSLLTGQRVMRSVGGGSPETPPDRFSGALGQGSAPQTTGMLRQLQRSYGNSYVGRVIQAKLTVGQPGDVYEQEADRVADAVMRMSEPTVSGVLSHSNAIQPMPIQRMCTECAEEEEERVHPKESAGQTPTVTPALEARLDGTRGGGEPLPEAVRSRMEPRLGADFSGVRVHTGGEADALNRELRAQAFTRQRDIYFGTGRYQPETRDGQRLLAHELTHVVQQGAISLNLQRQHLSDEATADTLDSESAQSEQALVEAIQQRNVSGVAAALQGRSIEQLRSLRRAANRFLGTTLERWLSTQVEDASVLRTVTRYSGVTGMLLVGLTPVGRVINSAEDAETALRILWPALPLVERLELYDEAYRELEQAQIDVIRAASAAEREAARRDSRMSGIYEAMSPEEEYDARILMATSEGGIDADLRYQATTQLISRANGIADFDDEDPVFDAILNLSLEQRRTLWDSQRDNLSAFLSSEQLSIIRFMATGTEAQSDDGEAQGTEAQALVARLRLATEGRFDDTEGIQTVVDRAAELLQEQQHLREEQASPDLSDEDRDRIETRLQELGDLGALSDFESDNRGSIVGRLVEAAGSPDQFGQWAQSLGADSFEIAKQRILMASGTFGVDRQAVEAALFDLHASPVEVREGESPDERERRQTEANNVLRQQLLADDAVRDVLSRMGYIDRTLVEQAAEADRFDELHRDFANAVSSGSYGEVFRIAAVFARRPDWKVRFEATATEFLSAYSRVSGEPREIIEEILRTGEIPISLVLAYTGNVETLQATLGELTEEQRGKLRLGYWLSRTHPDPESLTEEAQTALQAFESFEQQAQQSQAYFGIEELGVDREGVQGILDAALGNAPTVSEMESGAGRLRAAGLLYYRQQEHQALDRGLVTPFTETDETMDASAREYAALWGQVSTQGELSTVDFAALASLHQRFSERSQEFTEASETVSDIAGMVAATVAAMVVIAATGGTATPGVIAAAAAAGAGSRVLATEMFGGDYYNPASEEGAQDALLGALDGALAVVGSSLASRAIELMGLGGQALASGAARLAGEVAEQASQSLSRRVAASTVEAAIDGVLSGAISEAAGAAMDAQAWRQGIWQGLVKVGQAAAIGGLTGLGTGALMGAAMPIAGAALRRGWRAIAGESVEQAVERVAGAEARATLDAARRAAREGEQAEANRLFTQLEEQLDAQLDAEQLSRLRGELGLDGGALAHPSRTAEPATPQEERLLRESGEVPSGTNLTQEQLDAELSIVRRSQTQPTDLEGYVDEVDLGNGHKWARREDGTWCRFSDPSLCGTSIPGAPPPFRHLAPGHGRRDVQQLLNQMGEMSPEEFNALVDGIYAQIYQEAESERVLGTLYRRRREPIIRMLEEQGIRSPEEFRNWLRELLENQRIEGGSLFGEILDVENLTIRPGNPPGRMSPRTEAGIFAHDYAEPLRSRLGHATIPEQFSADVSAGNIITLDQLPDHLRREVELGVTARVDRITDPISRTIYEIKPNTVGSINAGLEQVHLRYVPLANSQPFLHGRSDWRGVVVVYDAERALEFIPR